MIDLSLARLFSASPQDRELGSASLQRRLRRERALIEEFAQRAPHIPLVQHRSGQDDSALGSAHFADLVARPRRVIPTDNPAVTYVELAFRYELPGGVVREIKPGRTRLYARIEDPLYLRNRSHCIEQVRNQRGLRKSYFRKIFKLLHAQSECNRELCPWMSEFLLPETGAIDRDFQAIIQNFNHNIGLDRNRPATDRQRFIAALGEFDFARQAPANGPVSLRLSVRPHQRTEGRYAQSVTSVLLGTARGPALRKGNGKVVFVPPGNAFESRFRAFIDRQARDKLESIEQDSYRKTAEERIWGAQGECAVYFHNHDTFVMKGLEWSLERGEDHTPMMMGTHRNVAAYRNGERRVAVKAVPFESVGDLVRLIQAHQYVHGVQAPALRAQARTHPVIAEEILTTVSSLLSARDHVPSRHAAEAWTILDQDTSRLFTRKIGPLLHQVTVDYDQKLLLAVLDWSAEGMLSDFAARKRLLEDCSLSHRLRMAANLLRNGHEMIEDDVTHTDLKPENILNHPDGSFRAQQKARLEGWDSLDQGEIEELVAGEPILEGDFSGMHFGREGAVPNLAPGEGLPTSIDYSSWKFTSLGLSEGTQPSVLKETRGKLPRIDTLVLEQDIANRGTSVWEIVYGSLVDCIPPAEKQQRIQAREAARERLTTHLNQAIRLKRRGEEDPEAERALETALQQCDRRLLDLVSLRSEIIDNKRRITPLFQHARDNRHGLTVWLDTRVIEMLNHLACDFRRKHITRQQVAKLYRSAESLFRAEAGRLESADEETARNRRLKMVGYMNSHELHFNPDCGMLGLSELPRQLERVAEMVEQIPEPRRALNEFARSWQDARLWGLSALDALDQLRIAQNGEPAGNGEAGRAELYELIRSTLLQEHDALIRLESRAGEEKMRPPFLGLFENRYPILCHDHEQVRLSHARYR